MTQTAVMVINIVQSLNDFVKKILSRSEQFQEDVKCFEQLSQKDTK